MRVSLVGFVIHLRQDRIGQGGTRIGPRDRCIEPNLEYHAHTQRMWVDNWQQSVALYRSDAHVVLHHLCRASRLRIVLKSCPISINRTLLEMKRLKQYLFILCMTVSQRMLHLRRANLVLHVGSK